MKASRLPRPSGPPRPRPLPVFSNSELARKRLRHLSGSSTGSCSSSIAEAPTKVHRVDSLPPSPPPVFSSDNGPKPYRHSSGSSRLPGVSAPSKCTAKDLTCSNARDKDRVSAVGAPSSGKAKKTSPAAASLPNDVPPPAPQRPPRVRRKDENGAGGARIHAGHRSSSSAPSTSAAPTPSTSYAATPLTSAAAPASQECDANNVPADTDDGFTLVSRKRKGKKGGKPGGDDDDTRQPGNCLPPAQPRPSPTPRTSLAPRQDSAPRPTPAPRHPRPAPRHSRPSVSVSRPLPPASEFPAFRVPAQGGYGTS